MPSVKPGKRKTAVQTIKRVGAVDNAVSILSFLANAEEPKRLTEISKSLRINGSTCFNILRTLETHGLVNINPTTKLYSTGSGLFALARRGVERGSELDLLKPHMDQIAANFETNISLWSKVDSDHLMLVAATEGEGTARISLSPGQRRPLIFGAMGRVMAAFGDISDKYIRTKFPSLRWVRPVDLETYMDEIEQTRRRGWAIDEGWAAVGLQVIAAPLYGRNNALFRVACATSFIGQHDPAHVRRIGERLVDLGNVLRKPY